MNKLTAHLQQELKRIKPATVLIVEPDPYLGRMLGDYLAGYVWQVVDNGRDALALCQQTPPHLILIDTHLPDMSAFGTADLPPSRRECRLSLVARLTDRADNECCHRKCQNGLVSRICPRPHALAQIH